MKIAINFKVLWDSLSESSLRRGKDLTLKSCIHSGNAGDIVYSLPTAKELGVNHYVVNLCSDPGFGGRNINFPAAQSLAPLLLSQSYIKRVTIVSSNIPLEFLDQQIDGIDFVLDKFRLHEPSKHHLAICHAMAFGVHINLYGKWLHLVVEKPDKEYIVLCLTPRYRSLSKEYWMDALSGLDNVIALGLPEELDCVAGITADFVTCNDFLEMARMIQGCRLFIGNPGLPYAIAEGLKVPRIIEVPTEWRNAYPIGRSGYAAPSSIAEARDLVHRLISDSPTSALQYQHITLSRKTFDLEAVVREKDTHIGNLEAAIRDKDEHVGSHEANLRAKTEKIREPLEQYGHLHRYRSANVRIQIEGLRIDEIGNLRFSHFTEPQVSIIIPVWNNWKYTYRCLKAILEHTNGVTYEVIIVDDDSSDETMEMLRRVENIRIISHESNLGYIKTCNQGAEIANAEYLVFLNNDTEPQEGWLENLLSIAEGDKLIGAVGAKLIYPDGKLQEAGGMIFSDGRPWNFGNGDDPEKEIYNQLCEVDYCSGACLLVRKSLFNALVGFDERYSPAYYEEADLCFAMRKMGYKVLYNPEAVVIHYESVTFGENAYLWGEISRKKFIEKWENELIYQDEHPSITGESPTTANRERLSQKATFENKAKILKNIYKLLDTLTEDRAARMDQVNELTRLLKESEADRAARLEVINTLTERLQAREADLKESEADRAVRLEVINTLTERLRAREADLTESEADRAARLEIINKLSVQLQESEVDREARLDQVNELARLLKESEADRAIRLEVIHKLEALLRESEMDREAKEKFIERVSGELGIIKSSTAYRLLKKIDVIP